MATDKKQGRPPDFRLKLLNKINDSRCNDAGAAWLNKDKSITIVLNPFLNFVPDSNILITLFPITKE